MMTQSLKFLKNVGTKTSFVALMISLLAEALLLGAE